jgi:hypothetical protein
MVHGSPYGKDRMNHIVDSGSKKTSSQGTLRKKGLLKKFLDWIAKGAKESHLGIRSCPT